MLVNHICLKTRALAWRFVAALPPVAHVDHPILELVGSFRPGIWILQSQFQAAWIRSDAALARRRGRSNCHDLDRPGTIEPIGKIRKRMLERGMMGRNFGIRMLIGHRRVLLYILKVLFSLNTYLCILHSEQHPIGP